MLDPRCLDSTCLVMSIFLAPVCPQSTHCHLPDPSSHFILLASITASTFSQYSTTSFDISLAIAVKLSQSSFTQHALGVTTLSDRKHPTTTFTDNEATPCNLGSQCHIQVGRFGSLVVFQVSRGSNCYSMEFSRVWCDTVSTAVSSSFT